MNSLKRFSSRPRKNTIVPRRPTGLQTYSSSACFIPSTISVKKTSFAFSTEKTKIDEPIFNNETEEVKAAEEVQEIKENRTEKSIGEGEQLEFQAETRKLLTIVAQSLYSEKEVFVRELISNASDALEKLRHVQATGAEVTEASTPLEINIYTDESTNTLVIQDYGIGMAKKELIKNLGSIGHSGSLEFLKNNSADKKTVDIIGQFGVGFYSAFMVSHHVTVYSRSATPGSPGYCWESDGTGTYKITEAEGVHRGTKIVIKLNEDARTYSQKDSIEKIIKKYSNFVGFDIKLNGQQVNTVKALWTLKRSEITEKDHTDFYQFIAHAFDTPRYHLQVSTDSPINIRSLLYVPQSHSEKYGMGRMEPGIFS